MGMGDRAFASTTELSEEIRDRHIGSVELLDFYLARAERHNPALNAIVVWQVDQARERARAADAKTAVEAVFIGKDRQFNRRFLRMCGHYLVEPTACTPASGWEKGQSLPSRKRGSRTRSG
jgi:hypothetical protein